ncbi:FAD-binding oxidoreductase [Chengkuizengella marina]|uniref:FAD-binding oxidoreductase n=1 Tax=Chengkuizengella marina TaxID=2507566 RepID=A0A6N9Q229_9BACL|nr:FAD-binding oxidoreductase [Chengkuizengella marina]NBI27918.1 FAD-binding oxidoreductase [Chengkuizengella marina]
MKKTKLTGKVIYPNDPAYQQARMNWNPFTNAFPIVFVFAQQKEDVSNAVRWARENNVPIRMRSGGHSLAKDFSQVNGGIVIDVSEMRNIELDEKNGTAVVEAGIRVGPLVKFLAQKGVLAPFGDSPTVGIGGISTGGGITVVQRTTGLISDNILAATLVDANGDVVTVSENNNPDLLWAIRGGGGGNFGIITSYTFKVRSAPFQVGIYEITWPWEQLEEVINVWQRWSPSVDVRLGSTLEVFSQSDGMLESRGIFFGSQAELEKLLAPLTGVGTPTKVFVKEVTLPEAIEFWIPSEPLFSDENSTWSSTWAELILPDEALKTIRSFLEKATGTSNFFFLNSGGAMNQVPSDETAFFWRNTKFYMEWNAKWTKDAEAQKNIRLVQNTRTELSPYIVGSYVNVPDLGIKNFGQEYYGNNFSRLQQVKAKFDPDNIFNFAQSIPPAKQRYK